MEPLQHLRKTGQPSTIDRGKVGTSEEGPQIGSQKDRIGPSPSARQQLGRCHVDLIDVWAFFLIHLDADEPLVHLSSDGRVGEYLSLHDMTPVAGRVPHRQEDRFVFSAGLGEGFLSPGIPVHRIVGMELKVGTALGSQSIRLPALRALSHTWMHRDTCQHQDGEQASRSTQ